MADLGVPSPTPAPVRSPDDIDKLRESLVPIIKEMISRQDPQAPRYQPPQINPQQAYGLMRNPQMAPQMMEYANAPAQGQYQQQLDAFKAAMDQKKEALGAATSLVAADTRADATAGKMRTRDINTVIPPGMKGAGQPIIVTEVTDQAGNVVSRRFTGYGKNPNAITDTNYGLLVTHQYGNPFDPFGGGGPGATPQGGAPPPAGNPNPPPPSAGKPFILRSDLQKRYGNDAAGMQKALDAAKARGYPVLDTPPLALSHQSSPGVGAGGFIQVGGKNLTKMPSEQMLSSAANQEDLQWALDAADTLWQSYVKKPGYQRVTEDALGRTPFLGGAFTAGIGYLDPDFPDVKQALERVAQINNYIVSGKQISEQEFARLRPNIPEARDAPEVARRKLARFKQEVINIRATRQRMAPGLYQ